jgi:hypothetical protein
VDAIATDLRNEGAVFFQSDGFDAPSPLQEYVCRFQRSQFADYDKQAFPGFHQH